jgi:hypothetical protein
MDTSSEVANTTKPHTFVRGFVLYLAEREGLSISHNTTHNPLYLVGKYIIKFELQQMWQVFVAKFLRI